MFYEGDLQSGISKAVAETKLVGCLVTDDGEESQLWENEFLKEPDIQAFMLSQTVLLRLEAGSQETGYLAAIFPIPKTPTLVLIQNGQLKEYIASGVSQEEFLRRLRVVFQTREAPALLETVSPQAEPTSTAATAPTYAAPALPPYPAEVESQSMDSTVTTASSQNPAPAAETRARAVQDLLAERSARLEAHKREQEAKEKAERLAAAKAKKDAMEASTEPGSKQSADMKYALMQKKRQQEARDERAQILKRVEDDKAERRQREAQRKAQASMTGSSDSMTAASSGILSSANNAAEDCALQIRLFDGSSIRSRFASLGSLQADVRPWVDGQKRVDIPYTFKHVLTPLPNKTFSITEEEQSLRSLGLPPSATLILVPVKGYTSAYEDGASPGMFSRGISAVYNFVLSIIAMITAFLGSFLGGGLAPARPTEPESLTSTPTPAAASSRINIRTLRDQEGRREDQQFYNGNALNFEPRKDEEDDKQE